MQFLERLRNYLKLFYLKEYEVLDACVRNNIPLTDRNIVEVQELLQHLSRIKKKKN